MGFVYYWDLRATSIVKKLGIYVFHHTSNKNDTIVYDYLLYEYIDIYIYHHICRKQLLVIYIIYVFHHIFIYKQVITFYNVIYNIYLQCTNIILSYITFLGLFLVLHSLLYIDSPTNSVFLIAIRWIIDFKLLSLFSNKLLYWETIQRYSKMPVTNTCIPSSLDCLIRHMLLPLLLDKLEI